MIIAWATPTKSIIYATRSAKSVPCDTSRTSIHPYQFPSCKQRYLGGVGVKTDLMFSRSVRGEGEAPVGAVLTRQDDLSKVKNKSLAFILLNVKHQLIS